MIKIFSKFLLKTFADSEKLSYLCTAIEKQSNETIKNGAIAQLVEQRTENPCVPGSIPGGTTLKKSN